jgi:hypothetical protein
MQYVTIKTQQITLNTSEKKALYIDILSKYEKASGSRINYNKTKAISIGTARHRKPKFNKISWIKEKPFSISKQHTSLLI